MAFVLSAREHHLFLSKQQRKREMVRERETDTHTETERNPLMLSSYIFTYTTL